MATTPEIPGQRLLPSLLDEIAKADPYRIIYSVAKTKNPADGFQDISARSFARAVNRCAWHIEKSLGRGHGFPTLTYMGPQDIVYPMLAIACIKTGYKLLLNSPRNTLEAHLSLFEKTDCNAFLLPPNFPLPVIKQILDARQMRVVDIPSWQHWIGEDGSDDPYPYNKTFAEARSDPVVILHTSGSTGLPKPIIQSHPFFTTVDALLQLPSLGYEPCFPSLFSGERAYSAFPLFHAAGLYVALIAPIYAGYTAVLGPSPPSADIANGVHVHANVQHSLLPPLVLAELANDPGHFENLGRLKYVAYGGGPLPQNVGDRVSSKTRLINCMGSTECGLLPTQRCDPEDWAYLNFTPIFGQDFRHVSGDMYEMVIVRDPEIEQFQSVFATFTDINEYPMKDLYSKHPTKEGLWLYRGRADDIVVYSTGEKLNPTDMEALLGANPSINAALIAGQGQFQSSLLVEAANPPTTEDEKEKLLDAIWSSVQDANKEGPSHARIHRNMIIFTSAEKPMLRASKGTVQRKATLQLYATELDALYQEAAINDHAKVPNGVTPFDSNSDHDPEHIVKNIIAACTDIDVSQVALDADLFQLGLDSLQVTAIARRINETISVPGGTQSVEPRTVYSNPSIASLTAVVANLTAGNGPRGSKEGDNEKMQKLYNLYAKDMPLTGRPPRPQSYENSTVLLTGSTGSLGSYILDSLINDTRVSRIYCLNRGPDSQRRQQESQTLKGLQPLPKKVVCLDADFSKSYFGLSKQEYMGLLLNVTVIIHNAWKVDFNQSIDSFSPHVITVRRLIDFSALSSLGARIFFISSIGSVMGKGGNVAEEIYHDWNTPQPMGYGQSKFISERLLDTAAKEAGIPTAVCRVGQVAGPNTTNGVWPKQEWLPSLIASSKYLGKVPDSLGDMSRVDWIPVDGLGQIIAELATSPADHGQRDGAVVYHTVNPQPTTWQDLAPTVVRGLGPSTELVPLGVWVNMLRESAADMKDVSQNPAVKLLDFFRNQAGEEQGHAILDIKRAASVSKTLRGMGPVQGAWMENWMRQWSF